MYALVTGGSRGIGAAICRRLAADGLDIVCNYRSSTDAAQEIAAAVRECGQDCELLACDVSDREASRVALEDLVERRGAPEVVVLNAGITRDGLFMWMSEADWDDVIGTGLGAVYNVVRPLLQHMLRARRGKMVAVASVSGVMGNAGQVNYAAAKGGLIAACKSLAKEVAKRGITVNAVAPGLIETELIKELPVDRLVKGVPLQRLGQVDDVAAAVAFLASPAANYITGQVLHVDGGLVM